MKNYGEIVKKEVEALGLLPQKNFFRGQTDVSGTGKVMWFLTSNPALMPFYLEREVLLIFEENRLCIHYFKTKRLWLAATKKQRELYEKLWVFPYEKITDFTLKKSFNEVHLFFSYEGKNYGFYWFDATKGANRYLGENYQHLASRHWFGLEED